MVHRRDNLRAEKILQKRLFEKNNVKILWNFVVNEIIGDDEEKDSKYVRICNIIGEKYNNDVIKFMREEEYDKKIYNYGRRKNFYKSITIHLNRCNIFLKEISEIKEKWI